MDRDKRKQHGCWRNNNGSHSINDNEILVVICSGEHGFRYYAQFNSQHFKIMCINCNYENNLILQL